MYVTSHSIISGIMFFPMLFGSKNPNCKKGDDPELGCDFQPWIMCDKYINIWLMVVLFSFPCIAAMEMTNKFKYLPLFISQIYTIFGIYILSISTCNDPSPFKFMIVVISFRIFIDILFVVVSFCKYQYEKKEQEEMKNNVV